MSSCWCFQGFAERDAGFHPALRLERADNGRRPGLRGASRHGKPSSGAPPFLQTDALHRHRQLWEALHWGSGTQTRSQGDPHGASYLPSGPDIIRVPILQTKVDFEDQRMEQLCGGGTKLGVTGWTYPLPRSPSPDGEEEIGRRASEISGHRREGSREDDRLGALCYILWIRFHLADHPILSDSLF